jgi:hypothetical protein
VRNDVLKSIAGRYFAFRQHTRITHGQVTKRDAVLTFQDQSPRGYPSSLPSFLPSKITTASCCNTLSSRERSLHASTGTKVESPSHLQLAFWHVEAPRTSPISHNIARNNRVPGQTYKDVAVNQGSPEYHTAESQPLTRGFLMSPRCPGQAIICPNEVAPPSVPRLASCRDWLSLNSCASMALYVHTT